MSSALPVSDREIWSRTLSFVLLGFLCYALPWPSHAAEPQTLLRIQGSNTIGAVLGPALIQGMFERQGFTSIRVEPAGKENEQQVLALSKEGRPVRVLVAAHGSGTGFTALADGSADLAASSRPIKSSEAELLASLGDFRSPSAEQIIALDGLAIIVHPQNPLQSLSSEQLAGLFSGEISDWSTLGGPAGPVSLYARDDQSGTFDTFKELVLSSHGKSLAKASRRYESSTQLSDAVSQDLHGIGFIGLPYVRKARALLIANGESQAMPASKTLIATEDYPLSRRLFLYHRPQLENSWVRTLIDFAHSQAGQDIVESSGFIPQTVQAVQVKADPKMPAEYRRLSEKASRLSVNFRFQEGSATLDSKAYRDLDRLVAYLQANDKLRDKVQLVGFGDAKADPARATLLSRLRAMAVNRELLRRGARPHEVIGLGDELPVATNEDDGGRVRNRRVEVWVY